MTAGECRALSVAERLMEQGAVTGRGRGRPRYRPKRVVGDKGSRSKRFRPVLRRHGLRCTIVRQVNEHRGVPLTKQCIVSVNELNA